MADSAEGTRKREQELKKIVLAWMNKKGFKCVTLPRCINLYSQLHNHTLMNFVLRRETAAAYEKDLDIHGSETLEQLAFRKGLETDFCIRNQILQWGMEDAKVSLPPVSSLTHIHTWTKAKHLIYMPDCKTLQAHPAELTHARETLNVISVARAQPTRYEESYVELREWTQSLQEDIQVSSLVVDAGIRTS